MTNFLRLIEVKDNDKMSCFAETLEESTVYDVLRDSVDDTHWRISDYYALSVDRERVGFFFGSSYYNEMYFFWKSKLYFVSEYKGADILFKGVYYNDGSYIIDVILSDGLICLGTWKERVSSIKIEGFSPMQEFSGDCYNGTVLYGISRNGNMYCYNVKHKYFVICSNEGVVQGYDSKKHLIDKINECVSTKKGTFNVVRWIERASYYIPEHVVREKVPGCFSATLAMCYYGVSPGRLVKFNRRKKGCVNNYLAHPTLVNKEVLDELLWRVSEPYGNGQLDRWARGCTVFKIMKVFKAFDKWEFVDFLSQTWVGSQYIDK